MPLICARVAAGVWQGRHVAVKTVLFQSSEQDNKLQLLAREATIATRLSHRCLARTFTHDLSEIDTGLKAGRRAKRATPAAAQKGTVFMFFMLQVSLRCKHCVHVLHASSAPSVLPRCDMLFWHAVICCFGTVLMFFRRAFCFGTL